MSPMIGLFRHFRERQARRATAAALRRLPAAQLADIGIETDGIDAAVEVMLQQERERFDVAAARRQVESRASAALFGGRARPA